MWSQNRSGRAQVVPGNRRDQEATRTTRTSRENADGPLSAQGLRQGVPTGQAHTRVRDASAPKRTPLQEYAEVTSTVKATSPQPRTKGGSCGQLRSLPKLDKNRQQFALDQKPEGVLPVTRHRPAKVEAPIWANGSYNPERWTEVLVPRADQTGRRLM